MTGTFGFRLALWYFALFVVGVSIVLVLAYGLLAGALRARDREIVESTLVRYSRAYDRAGLGGLNAAVAADRNTGRYEPLFVRVLTPSGASAVFFSMPSDWGAFDLTLPATPVDDGAWLELAAAGGGNERLEVSGVRLRRGELLQIGKSTRDRDELLGRFRESAAVLFVVVIAAALGGGATLTWSALRPLRGLTAAVGSILQTGDVRARVPVTGSGDPLDDAAALVNRMLDRIEGLIASLRGSLDNVAHDLRTPMTRLRATAETALSSPRTAEEYRAALADCLEEAERAVVMLETLMDIAEAETGVMTLRPERVDVVPLVRSAVELYADLAEAKQIELRTEAPPALAATADPARLRQAVANLIDNAVKYTPEGGRVAVAISRDAASITIRVSDTGVGIAPGELPRIWERLYRADVSRSERGLGLGLSLVKAIVEAHRGSVEVESRPGGGSHFTIRLPDTDVMVA
jgi:signal transduction histidine kinase